MTSYTKGVKTGCGTMHVIYVAATNEVLAYHGHSGSCGAAQADALARMATLAMHHGASRREVVIQLRGIQCPNPTWGDGCHYLSCADAFAQALLAAASDMDNDETTEEDANVAAA